MKILLEKEGGASPIYSPTYTMIKELTFDCDNDIIGAQIATNEFSAKIITNSYIDQSGWEYAILKDNNDNKFAYYFIKNIHRIDQNVVELTAQNVIGKLDDIQLSEGMLTNYPISNMIFYIFRNLFGRGTDLPYYIDSSLSNVTVSGYVPAQTARERIQWMCFACNIFVKTEMISGNYMIEFYPLSEVYNQVGIMCLPDQIYYKPIIEHVIPFSKLILNGNTYSAEVQKQDLEAGDQYIEVITGDPPVSHYYPYVPWVSDWNLNLTSAPRENMFTSDTINFINETNWYAISDELHYFLQSSDKIAVEMIMPTYGDRKQIGDKLYLVIEDKLYTGYVTHISFEFGNSIKQAMTLSYCKEVTATELNLKYTCNSIGWERNESYLLPTERNFPFYLTMAFDVFDGEKRYILTNSLFRIYTADIPSYEVQGIVEVPCEVALVYDIEEQSLEIKSIDQVTLDGKVLTIG